MRSSISFAPLLLITSAILISASSSIASIGPLVVTDQTNYNVGALVSVRSGPKSKATLSIYYAGDPQPVASGLRVNGEGYRPLWTIPTSARTGRYLIGVKNSSGKESTEGSFAVHRQLAKVISFDLDKTFYTSGDPVNPRIVVQNISDRPLDHLQVEFEAYTYPWIAPAADEPPAWKTIANPSLSLAPGETKEFRLQKAAVVQASDEQTYSYYSAIIRDARQQDHIYDLAFALPAITSPAGQREAAKSYPSLYLYRKLKDVPKSETYRDFYPPQYVSNAIAFDKTHTMFVAQGHTPPSFSFHLNPTPEMHATAAGYRVLDKNGQVIIQGTLPGSPVGEHQLPLNGVALKPGAYTLEVSLLAAQKVTVATNRLDFAVNIMPKSLLIFCAHEDDDTAHPEMIRAAVENHIPLKVVYFTSGDAGGCDRYFMHSCDASRAMEFGEVRMDEARASLGHLGVPPSSIHFLGLPDGGMEQIWKNYPSSSQPYLSVMLASEHSPYAGVAIPNLPYSRDAVLNATRNFIERYQPEMILAGHPDERHVDHRTNAWFVVKAMQELVKAGKLSRDTQLVVDAVYGPGPQKHAPFRYEKFQFYMSGQASTLGQEALWYYQSQDGNHQQAEIIPYSQMEHEAPKPHYGIYIPPYPHFRILDWLDHSGWNE
jgi:LmbE family N-acetylglucosaminyl deacetylase